MAVLLAVPISPLGPVATLMALCIDNKLYTQMGTVLLIALRQRMRSRLAPAE